MRFENPPEESPDVPPFMIVVQQDRFHLILVIIGIIVWWLLGQKLRWNVINYIWFDFLWRWDGILSNFLHLCLSWRSACESVARIIMLDHFPRRFLRRRLIRKVRIESRRHNFSYRDFQPGYCCSLWGSDLWTIWQRSFADLNFSCSHFFCTFFLGWETENIIYVSMYNIKHIYLYIL